MFTKIDQEMYRAITLALNKCYEIFKEIRREVVVSCVRNNDCYPILVGFSGIVV